MVFHVNEYGHYNWMWFHSETFSHPELISSGRRKEFLISCYLVRFAMCVGVGVVCTFGVRSLPRLAICRHAHESLSVYSFPVKSITLMLCGWWCSWISIRQSAYFGCSPPPPGLLPSDAERDHVHNMTLHTCNVCRLPILLMFTEMEQKPKHTAPFCLTWAQFHMKN